MTDPATPPVTGARPPIAWAALAIVAAAIVGLHALCLTRYGWFRDELYYLSCAHRLAWGYVDQPPLSIAVLAITRKLAGDSLVAFRLVAVTVSALVSVSAGLLARELGGGRFAQALAALALGLAPLSLAIGHYYSMNVFDFLFWVLAMLAALRAIRRGGRGAWIPLGLLLGLGLLNKWSVAWLGAGLAVALVVSPRRGLLRTPGPWLAAGIALALASPHLAWQIRHGWPTLEFMHNARTEKMAAIEPVGFLLNQLVVLGPGSAPIWVAGLVAALARERWRPLAVTWLVTAALVLGGGSARAEYLALAAAPLFAAGAVWWEARPRAWRVGCAGLALVLAIPVAPLALPILPVQALIAYQARLGGKPATEERKRVGALAQHDADMFGWPELADSVARVAATLPGSERARAIVLVNNYGEAGALERFGAGRLPTIACQHNNWYLWGPPKWDGGTAILVGRDSSGAAAYFTQVRVAGRAGHPLAMPYEQDLPILIARGFRGDVASAWARGKHYD